MNPEVELGSSWKIRQSPDKANGKTFYFLVYAYCILFSFRLKTGKGKGNMVAVFTVLSIMKGCGEFELQLRTILRCALE